MLRPARRRGRAHGVCCTGCLIAGLPCPSPGPVAARLAGRPDDVQQRSSPVLLLAVDAPLEGVGLGCERLAGLRHAAGPVFLLGWPVGVGKFILSGLKRRVEGCDVQPVMVFGDPWWVWSRRRSACSSSDLWSTSGWSSCRDAIGGKTSVSRCDGFLVTGATGSLHVFVSRSGAR